MAKKRLTAMAAKVAAKESYALTEAWDLLKGTASAKFDESVDVAINLGVDAKKSDQNVRGSTVLPEGLGKSVRVAVFAAADKAEEAEKAGADIVGMDELAAQIKQGKLDFDTVIAAPEAMPLVGKLGQILGPRGLMPNPKSGTVTADITTAVQNAKAGQVQFRIDKGGIVHCSIGKASFSATALQSNFEALLAALYKAKPATAKGQYVKRVSIATTMGPRIRINRSSLPAF